ncbi:hypothetical protein Tco_0688510 [Tanacetum coccineum]
MPCSCDRRGMWDRRVSIGHTSNANSGLSILEPLMELIIEHCTGKCNYSISDEMVSYPSSNNQLETSSNAMYQDAMKERQTLSCVDNSSKSNDDMVRKYITSIGAFTVTTNALFQADGVEVYDSYCDDVPNSQPSFMANISSYGFDVLAEYVTESQQTAVQNSNSSAQQDALMLSMIKQLKSQVNNCTKINLDNKSVNDSLTVELEDINDKLKFMKEDKMLI